MHPDGHWIKPEEKDSIAKAHQRLDSQIFEHLKRIKELQEHPGEEGDWARQHFPQASIMAALHHRVLWWDTYINRGALDEQISNRVRAEMQHVHLLTDEAVLKLRSLIDFCEQADTAARLRHKMSRAAHELEKLNDMQDRMNDAVPMQYKLQFKRMYVAMKKALAA
jgi:hypothetical protein